MGGGCACNDSKENLCFSPGSNIPLDSYQNRIEQNEGNKKPNKTNLLLPNIMEANINKRHSDFHNYEKKNFEKNLKLKISNMDGKNTSCNETNNKRISSNFNSSNFCGSIIYPGTTSKKNNEIIEEEDLNMNVDIEKKDNNLSPIIQMNESDKKNSIANKIKEKEDGLKKAVTNINKNPEENNHIISISKESSLIDSNEIENYELTTPKMMLEKENLDEIFKGNKKLFSHLCKNNHDKVKKVSKNVFIHPFDMNKYSEEMLYIINKIRTSPESFIKDIDYLISNNIKKTEEGTFIVSHEVDEKIKLMDDYMVIFENVKKILKKMDDSDSKISKLDKIKYNDELEIIFDESEYEENENESSANDMKNLPLKMKYIDEDSNGVDIGDEEEKNIIKYNDNINIIDFNNENDKEKENNFLENIKIKRRKKNKEKRKRNINKILDLNDDKIANLILQKRKEIKNDFPHNIFKMSVIKDIKINFLFQIGLDESLKDIIFSPEYTNFAVNWTNELNRNFISIACFAQI